MENSSSFDYYENKGYPVFFQQHNILIKLV